MGKLTLILGGARSGKSTYAERIAHQRDCVVLYIATAEALDREMADRIEKHKAQRPERWETREIPRGVGAVLRESPPKADLVLLDCLTLLISNVILGVTDSVDEPNEERAARAVDAELNDLLEAIAESDAEWIIVSNEVGMGLVPPYPLGRLYRDQLGWANRQLASSAEEVYLLAAGMVLPLHDLGHPLGE